MQYCVILKLSAVIQELRKTFKLNLAYVSLMIIDIGLIFCSSDLPRVRYYFRPPWLLLQKNRFKHFPGFLLGEAQSIVACSNSLNSIINI